MSGIQRLNKLAMGLFLLLAFSACGGGSNPSTDATLSSLSLSAGDLEPAYAPGITNYGLTTSSGSTTVTPTVSQDNASVTVNNIPIASGTESVPFLLTEGDTVINVVVTAEDESTTQTYTITVTRTSAESSDSTLSGLTLSAGDITPAFASGTTSYSLATTSETTTVTPTVNQADANVTVNGTEVISGVASSSIDLAVGDTTINVLVTAEDGSTTQTYTVTVSRSAVVSNDATLLGLTLSAGDIEPVFATGTTSYALTTSGNTTTVTPTVNQTDATVTVNGAAVISGTASNSIDLAVGDTVISVVVTAEDGSTIQTYTVTVSRSPSASSDATLSGLMLSVGTINPVFASGTTSYTLTTSGDSTTVTPTVNQTGATVTVNGANVTSGAASEAIALGVGETAISVVVTAEDGSTTQTYSVTVSRTSAVGTLELIDPTPGVGDEFGTFVVPLANGNIVVSDPYDSTVANNSGAVHLYNSTSSTPIASIYGDNEDDNLGSNGIFALGNNNYVIASSNDDESGIFDASSVRLVNGSTGVQIGAALIGDVPGDQLGSDGIIVLSNDNYVIASQFDDVGGIVNAGSTQLVDGSTGLRIGAILAGDVEGDGFGFMGIDIAALGNNNYVVASFSDDEGGIVDAGSVRLINGSTGEQIGATLTGDVAGDQLGFRGNQGNSGITVLGNNNYVIASEKDDESGIVDSGSVRLMNGNTGVQIGAAIVGDVEGDALGYRGRITALGNNNFVIASSSDDEGGIVNAGSVRLINGSTGVQIGTTIAGDVTGDGLGVDGTIALDNNNYVIGSSNDDENGISQSGSVRLVDGNTGEQIGATLSGDTVDDRLSRVIAVGNNYLATSVIDDVDGIIDAGSIRLMNGSTGEQIGTTLAGDSANDNLGRTFTVLDNNNVAIGSQFDTVDGIFQAGSVRLLDGSTGQQIGATIAGDVSFDRLAQSGTTAVGNNNYVIETPVDDEGGVVDAGSVRLVNGTTGVAIGAAIVGAVSGDMFSANVTKPVSGDYYILSQPNADNAGLLDSGMVRIIEL